MSNTIMNGDEAKNLAKNAYKNGTKVFAGWEYERNIYGYTGKAQTFTVKKSGWYYVYYVIIKYVQKLLNKNVHMVSSKTYQGGLKMILKTNIITNLEINGLEDLHKLKPLMEHTNINRSQIARELGVDRRTVDKYINGFKKSEHRTSSNCLSNYQEKIRELLDDENDQVFYYRRNLWRYLGDCQVNCVSFFILSDFLS